MNTFTRLSTISTSDIIAIRDKYYAENPKEDDHGWFRDQRPISLSSTDDGQIVRSDGPVTENGYKAFKSDEIESDKETMLCGTMRNQVIMYILQSHLVFGSVKAYCLDIPLYFCRYQRGVDLSAITHRNSY